MFNKLLGCYRVVYNQCLARKIKSYEETKTSENLSTLGQFIHHELLKDDNFVWLREQNTKVLKQAVRDMLSAYKNFFEQHTGYPKFKSKHDNKQSCRFELGAISKRNVYTDYKISLANIRNVKFRCSKKYVEYLEKHKNCIKQATLKRLLCGEYYLSILVDGDLMHQAKETNSAVGIDLGIKDFVVDFSAFGSGQFAHEFDFDRDLIPGKFFLADLQDMFTGECLVRKALFQFDISFRIVDALKEKLAALFDANDGMMRTGNLSREKIYYADIQWLIREGYIEKVRTGYYQWVKNADPSELSTIVRLFPDGILCMDTALRHYGYSDRTPAEWHLAVSKDSNKTRFHIDYPFVKPYYIEPKVLLLGTTKVNMDGHEVCMYDKDRLICDCLRYRNKMDKEIFNKAIQSYIKDSNKNIPKLLEYAEPLRVKRLVKDLIGVWL